MTQNNGHYVA